MLAIPLLIAAAVVTAATPVGAAETTPAAAPLAIPINLRCTTCDDFIRCTGPGAPRAPAAVREPAIVYRLKEKTFWAQVATIGDYLVQLFRVKTTDQRPLAIYRDDGAARRIDTGTVAVGLRAAIDAAAAIIDAGAERIDQRNGQWLDARGVSLGRCVAMQRRDGYNLVRAFLGKPPLVTPPASRP